MPYLSLANRLAFQKVKEDDPRMPDGPETIIVRGKAVPEWVSTFQVSALVSAGLLVWAEEPDPRLVPDNMQPPTGRTPDQPVVLPSDPQGSPILIGDVVTAPSATVPEPVPTPETPSGPTAPLPPLPKASDSKETWEQYATRPQIGMALGEAEAMNKTDLMTEVKARHARATSAE